MSATAASGVTTKKPSTMSQCQMLMLPSVFA